MKNIHIIFLRIWPYIQLNHSHPFLQGSYDGNVAAVTIKLITSQIGIVASIYKVMRHRGSHIMMHLKVKTKKRSLRTNVTTEFQ